MSNDREIKQRFIQIVVGIVLQYGIPAAVDLIRQWKSTDEPTIEDVESLRQLVKKPKEYFHEG